MTGFLTRIAARLSGSEGMLRPRTPSLFEPSATAAFNPAVAGTPAEQQPWTSAFERAHEVDARGVARSPATGRVSPPKDPLNGTPVVTSTSAALDHRATSQPEAVGAGPVARVISRDPRGQAQPASIIEAKATHDAPALNGAPTALRPAAAIERTQGMPAYQVGETDTIGQIEARRVVVRHGAVPTSPQLSATGTPDDDRRDITRAISQPASSVDGILRAPVVARMASESPLTTQRAQNSEPTIHVTIGRVEVRAVAASPSDSTRPERPSPVMSLDEYLRTRGG
jgi:hypothetical protein